MKSKKLVLVILFIFIFSLILNLNIFASEPSEPYTMPYWFIWQSVSTGDIYIKESEYPILVSEYDPNGLSKFLIYSPSASWNLTTNKRIRYNSGPKKGLIHGMLGFISLYANHDICFTNGSVFFSKILPKSPSVLKETLSQHPPLTLMKSRLVGLIPLLIGLLIVSVGFYKGLSVLFKALRQA